MTRAKCARWVRPTAIDIFGGNCLGVADSWNRVRHRRGARRRQPRGGADQGIDRDLLEFRRVHHAPIAQYLSTEGWGTTTLISSGKDVYIHYAARDFAHAFKNDTRSKAAVLYAEPGGYYEHGVDFGKPTVACVVGRWKSKLTRAVGHAGAMAGSGDKAEDKEGWFMENFGVDGIFTPENPIASAKGAVVINIAHIPAALTAVMKLNGIAPDFAPRGSLSLKPWIANDQGLKLPAELAHPNGGSHCALQRTDRSAEGADRRGYPTPEHEGSLWRIGHGPENAGHERSRLLGARSRAGPGRSQFRASARARDCWRK